MSYKGSLWNRVIQSLPVDKISTKTIDFPPYGSKYESGRFDFDTFPQYLRDKLIEIDVQAPYFLIGHSLGGLVALKYTSRYPNDVAGLVLVSTPLRSPESKVPLIYRIATTAAVKFPIDSLIKRVLRANGKLIEALRIKMITAGYVNPDFLKGSNMSSVARCHKDLFEHDFRNDIGKVENRALLIYGINDKPLLSISGTELYASFRRGKVVIIDSNHSIPVNYPSLLGNLILEFIENNKNKYNLVNR